MKLSKLFTPILSLILIGVYFFLFFLFLWGLVRLIDPNLSFELPWRV